MLVCREVYTEIDAFTLFALSVCLGEQVDWGLVFI
jgi:hypothetical protein